MQRAGVSQLPFSNREGVNRIRGPSAVTGQVTLRNINQQKRRCQEEELLSTIFLPCISSPSRGAESGGGNAFGNCSFLTCFVDLKSLNSTKPM